MTAGLDPSQRILLLRMQQRPAPIAALIAAVLPLAGVLLLGWPVEAMFGLYWAESVMVGVFHWLTLFSVRGAIDDPKLARDLAQDTRLTPEEREQRIETDRRWQVRWAPWVSVAFYGLFFAVHAGALALLFDGAFSELATGFGVATLMAMSLQPALDYRAFRADDELRSVPAAALFLLPFKRVGVLQMALLLGAIPIGAGHPLGAALVLTMLKVCVELSYGRWPRAKGTVGPDDQGKPARVQD